MRLIPSCATNVDFWVCVCERRRRDHSQDQDDDDGGGGGGGDAVGVVASRENQSLEKKIVLRILNPSVMRITGEGRR